MRMESTSPVRPGQGHAPVIAIVLQTAPRLPHGRSAGRTLLAAQPMAMPQAGHRVPRLPIGLILLGQVAWVGLALFLTAGFAVGVSLFAGRSALDPGPRHACGLFFAWCVILIGSTQNA
jgi:hypothetical protein